MTQSSSKRLALARASFSTLAGLVVSVSSFKWAIDRNHKSLTLLESIEKADAEQLIVASVLALSVTLGNACQYYPGVSELTTKPIVKIKNYFNSDKRAARKFTEVALTCLFSLASGAALGALYQQEFENDNHALRLFVFSFMAITGVAFTFNVNYQFINGAFDLAKAPKKKLNEAKDFIAQQKIAFLVFASSLTAYYFLFGKNTESVAMPLLFNQPSSNALGDIALWGLLTLAVSATFAVITAQVVERLTEQATAVKTNFGNKKIARGSAQLIGFVLLAVLAAASITSVYVGINDAVNNNEYDSLGWSGKHFEYMVTPFCFLSNLSALAGIFNPVMIQQPEADQTDYKTLPDSEANGEMPTPTDGKPQNPGIEAGR